MLEELLKKINDKGWNLYEFGAEENLELAVPKGAASELVVGKNYVVIPRISQDKDLVRVKEAIKGISRRQVFPIMRYLGEPLPLTYFSLKQDIVTVHAETDVDINYRSFSKSLDTLFSSYAA